MQRLRSSACWRPQYAPFGGETLSRRAAADALSASHGLPFTFRDIVLTPGAMSALHLTLSPRHPARAAVADELVRWTRITGIATPTALMQRALPRLLTLRHVLDRLDEWRARLLEELTQTRYRVVEPAATLFLCVQTPPGYDDDFAFIEELAGRGVLALPAPVFHHQGGFACP